MAKTWTVSLDLRSYLTSDQSFPPNVQVMQSTLEQVMVELQASNTRKALHLVQFEHKHPQMAVAHSLFRNLRSKTFYCKSESGQKTQHLLHAALNNQRCPYSERELEDICTHAKMTVKRSNSYDRDIKMLHLADQLLQSSQEFVAFVTRFCKNGTLELCFSDPILKVLKNRSIHLKHLNAS